MREIINKGSISDKLTPEVLKEILEFMKQLLETEFANNNLPIFHVVALIEDEVFERFRFEIEELERAYEMFLDSFKEFDVIFQTICQYKLIPSIEECYKQYR